MPLISISVYHNFPPSGGGGGGYLQRVFASHCLHHPPVPFLPKPQGGPMDAPGAPGNPGGPGGHAALGDLADGRGRSQQFS